MAQRHSCSASVSASRPTASSEYSTTTWKTQRSTVCVTRVNVTGQPACACRPSAAKARTWATEMSPWWPVRRIGPMFGKRARRRASKPGSSHSAHSASLQWTTASIAVLRLHRLGPRKARTRVMSIEMASWLDVLCMLNYWMAVLRTWLGWGVMPLRSRSNVSMPTRMISTGMPSATAAPAAASRPAARGTVFLFSSLGAA